MRRTRFIKVRSKKAPNGYTYRVKVPYINEYGLKDWIDQSGFKTKKEAVRFAREKELEVEKNGGTYQKNNYTVNEVFDDYMKNVGSYKYAFDTKKNYNSTFDVYIRNSIGTSKIKSLHYKELQNYFNKLCSLSKGRLASIKNVLAVTFKYAIRCGYIEANPIPLIELHGEDSNVKTKAIAYDDFNKIIDWFLTESGHHKVTFATKSNVMALYLGYFLGLRISEALAIEKSDFDFDNDQVYINKRLEYGSQKKESFYVTDRMKTKASKAVLPLPQPLKDVLVDWFNENPYELVCCKESGDYIAPNALGSMIRHCSKELGIKFRYHSMRHSYATNLVTSGVDVGTVAKLCRHSKVSTTLDIYTNVHKQDMNNAVDSTFNNGFYKKDTKNVPILDNKALN